MCVHKRNVGCTYPYIPQCTWCAETIHRAPKCFMYVHGTSLLVFLTWHLLKFLLGKYSVWKLKKDFDFQKTNTTGLIFKKSSKTGYQYNYICLPANNMSFEWIIQYLLWKLNNIDCVPNERDFEKKFTLFIIHVRKIWGGGKKTKNSFNLVHSGDCFLPDVYHSQQPKWDNSGL